MFVTVFGPNLRDQSKGTFHVHQHLCADIAKKAKRDPAYRDGMTFEASTQREVVEFIYEDCIFANDEEPWTDYHSDLHFCACCSVLPIEEDELDDPHYDEIQSLLSELWESMEGCLPAARKRVLRSKVKQLSELVGVPLVEVK